MSFIENVWNTVTNRNNTGNARYGQGTGFSQQLIRPQVQQVAQWNPDSGKSTQQVLDDIKRRNVTTRAMLNFGNKIRAEVDAINNMPGPDDGSGSAGGGYAAPPPLVLPRMQLPAPELLAQQAFMAVDAARAPYTAALAALAQSRTQGDQAITMADRDAATAGRQIQSDWQRRTAGVEGNIAGVYRQALDGLASVIAANNQSMMNAGFQPAAAGQNEALGRLAGLGASAREAALVRRQLGADMARDQGAAVAGVTQAGRGALASTYAQVLGSLQAQQSAAEAAARFEQFNREMALRQEIDRINYDASVQEAMANR